MARVGIEAGQGYKIQYVPISVSSGTTQLVAAQGIGKRVSVVSYAVVVTTAGTVKFTDADADLTGAMAFAANGGIVASGQPSSPFFKTGQNEALSIVTTATTNGHLGYILEP